MDLKELENNVIVNGINVMIMNARMSALENILFGFLNVELEDRQKGASIENKKLFLNFYLENVHALKAQLHASLDQNPIVKMILKETEEQTKLEILNLGS